MTKYFSFTVVFLISVLLSQNVETIIYTEATGGDASVKTEITNIVNGEVTKVESSKEGEIKVETKNGKTEVKISNENKAEKKVSESNIPEKTQPKKKISFLQSIFLRFSGFVKIFIPVCTLKYPTLLLRIG